MRGLLQYLTALAALSTAAAKTAAFFLSDTLVS